MANPRLNALIIGVLLIGIMLAFRQVIRLFPEVAWVNGFRLADPGLAVERPPVLLAPMAAILGDRIGRMAISLDHDARHARFDRHPARRGARHLALHDRAADLPRPARHVLGPDRDRRLGRQRDQQPQGRRRRRRDVRFAAGGPRGAAQRHGHLVLVLAVRPRRLAGAGLPRPADRARRRTASTPSSRTGSSTTVPRSRRRQHRGGGDGRRGAGRHAGARSSG